MSDESGSEVVAHVSSGNVFADLGLPEPEECLAKAEVVFRITERIRELGLSQREAAGRVGVPQPALSKLLRGHTEGFSLDRLFKVLNALDQTVEITIRPKRDDEETGRLIVTRAAA